MIQQTARWYCPPRCACAANCRTLLAPVASSLNRQGADTAQVGSVVVANPGGCRSHRWQPGQQYLWHPFHFRQCQPVAHTAMYPATQCQAASLMLPGIDPLRWGKDKRVMIDCVQTQKQVYSARNELACHLNVFPRRAVQHLDCRNADTPEWHQVSAHDSFSGKPVPADGHAGPGEDCRAYLTWSHERQ